MGLLGKLFGGGTELSVALTSSNVIAGGTVAGKVTLTGGKKPLTLTGLTVRVFYVSVTTTNDSPLPNVELRKLSEVTVAANQAMPAGKSQTYEFTAQLPDGLDPAGSYKVVASADIPSVKDPQAEADFKVITPGAKRGGVLGAVFGASEDELLGRYPGLLDSDEGEQFSALCELRGDAYGESGKKLVAVAPFLLRFAKTGPEDLRDEALETWATILNNRARESDIKELVAFAQEPMGTDLKRAVVIAATKFADEGAAPLLAQLAKDADPDVRAQVARSLYIDADEDLPGRLELVVSLTKDPDVGVRRAAASALGAFTDNQAAMDLAVQIAGADASPEVRAEAIEAVGSAHYNGMLELVISAYQTHVASPSPEVRTAIAGRISSLPNDPRVTPLVHTLLSDRSSEVRRRMAGNGAYMSDHPQLAPLFRAAAESDQDDEVRSEAVYGMRGFLSPAEAVAFARQRFAQDQTEKMAWSTLNMARSFDDHTEGKQLLSELTRCQYSYVASSARDALK